MTSTFTWLDHSEEHRRKILDVLDLFREKSTVDELGLGTIRDAFADMLFPGTSAPQTKARYFLFIPWIYLSLEHQRVSSAEIARRARNAEINLIERLLDSGENDGVIGRVARATLQRLPSNIYWSGLRRLGICLFSGSQDTYHHSLDRYYRGSRNAVVNDDGEAVAGLRANWHASLPHPPESFPEHPKLALTKDEAVYLRERIVHRAPGTLFEHLVTKTKTNDGESIEFPWMHPRFAEFSDKIRGQLQHARNFSEIMYGAILLYNLCLAELTKSSARQEEYRSELERWSGEIDRRMNDLEAWDSTAFWNIVASEGARISLPTRTFIERWWDLVLIKKQRTPVISDDKAARDLIVARERQLKGPLARVDNARARDLWSGASGTDRLAYRWPNAQRISCDILQAAESSRA
jgi:Family of unknown function (DUF6361)